MGDQAYKIIPAEDPSKDLADYRVGPLDEMSITVFQEPDLSLKEVRVDASGNILLPLIGQVRAAGRTTPELAKEIARLYGERLLVNPQITLNVTKATSQTVTVEGEVKKPGIYEIPGSLTLIQSVALAEGAGDYAKTDEIIVFRIKEGQRYAARFNLRDIRTGKSPDPALQGRDVVVVGYSSAKHLVGQIIATVPAAAGLFVAISQISR
jgi:polysaccharide export outer membrane protein